MRAELSRERLRRLRLAAQCLLPGHEARSPREAARAVVGVQAQDVRAAALALRARVPGLERRAVDDPGLVRTWSVRGTAHLIDVDDRDWLHAALGPRNRRTFDAIMRRRGALDIAHTMLPEMLAVLERGPRDRASLLEEVGAGHGELGPAVNVLIPWAVSHGCILSLADGRLRIAEPPAELDEEEARAILARRYLAGYGPASAEDLAAWSGLALGHARRALHALEPLDRAGHLLALPGTLDLELRPPVAVRLLGAFDTTMLGHRRRELLLEPVHDHLLLRGGGMVRPVVLSRGNVTGFWRLAGSGRRRTLEVQWLAGGASGRALEAESRDVARFLEIDLAVTQAEGIAAEAR
ncbi:MAG: DNA glycosylase AlkZ-like family protein [Solirubrobacteraceae bacterium]